MSTPALSPPRDSSSHTPAPAPASLRLSENFAACPQSPNYLARAADPAGYFGLGADSTAPPRPSWNPTVSRILPLNQNPEFDQFRRQSSEISKEFALTDFRPTPALPPHGAAKSHLAPKSTPPSAGAPALPAKPRSPKRLLSTDASVFTDRPRRCSPASFLDRRNRPNEIAQFERPSRSSVPPAPTVPTLSLATHRAETLPTSLDDDRQDGPVMVTSQHVINVMDAAEDEVLLLDLRVSTQYAKSHIAGALNLCIPTTLLKRASFTVRKLADTFQDDDQREKFERWRSSKYLVVYDHTSSQLSDAGTCVHTLKKFAVEGWKGALYIVRGGFVEFAERFPAWVVHESQDSASAGSDADLPAAAPVAGGCPLPATKSAVNPFFGNIRQNMDLIGGVGQFSVTVPADMTTRAESGLPRWLRRAADADDNGRLVSEKFLGIEKREQKRMQEALSGKVVYGTPTGTQPVQIAGIEKGSKNRYNSIWPYEHSRVKLGGVAAGGCDYVNANYVRAPGTNKRYIATQGPLPATFSDFWSVVWQQDVRVVVMLTAEHEGGQVKAHNYWQSGWYGPLQLTHSGEDHASLEPGRSRIGDRPSPGQRRPTNPPKIQAHETATPGPQPYVIVRKLTLSNRSQPLAEKREITQLQYSSWPDFGAPAHPAHLLGLIEQCDKALQTTNRAASRPFSAPARPVLVHCSAGCGRTGTFCTVDSVLDILKQRLSTDPAENDDADVIEQTVDAFRQQRLSMVQSLRQFVLCYESIIEWLVEQRSRQA